MLRRSSAQVPSGPFKQTNKRSMSAVRVCSKTDCYVLEMLEQRLFSKSTDKAEVAHREKKCQGRQCSSDPRFKRSSRTMEDGSCDTGVSRRWRETTKG